MADTGTKPRVVLVVEDEPGIRSALQLLLGFEGYAVVLATNGQEALDVLSRTHCDVIVTDQMMPVMDGLAFLAHIGGDARYADTPKILMSAVARRPESVRALADLFIPKPFETATLLRAIEGLLWAR